MRPTTAISDGSGNEDIARVRSAEFTSKLRYIRDNYQVFRAIFESHEGFNASLGQLRGRDTASATRRDLLDRLHPEIQILVKETTKSGIRGSLPAGSTYERRLASAVEHAGSSLRPIRGRPADRLLSYHVEALMALIEEFSGVRPTGARYTQAVYAPNLRSAGGRIIEMVFRTIDPRVTSTSLVNIMRAARRRYGDTPMRFRKYFPLYGLTARPF